MDQRERILEAVAELTTARRRLPSILEVATEVGLTKQGVLHYFPTRGALDAAVVTRAIDRVDTAMREAAAGGSPTATYLRLSSPDDSDCAAAVVVLAAATQRPERGVPPEAQEAAIRWETLIADEVGDAVRAEVVRLVGDGLFVEALIAGVPPTIERIDRLISHLRDTPVERRT